MSPTTDLPCCGNCPKHKDYSCKFGLADFTWGMTEKLGCLHHPGARAYLNKDVIEKLESDLKNGTGAYHKNGKHEQKYWIERVEEVIALLRGDGR